MTPDQIRLEMMKIKIELNSGYLINPDAEIDRCKRLMERLRVLRELQRKSEII